MASYPTSVKSFTTKTSGDTIAATHPNDLQDEVSAIETGLLNGVTHVLKPSAANTYDLGTSSLGFKDLYLEGEAYLGDGTVSLPSYTFELDPDTGVYRSGTNALDFATNATKALGIDATQFIDSPTQPRCSAYSTATQSVSTATDTYLTFDAEDYDVGTMHDNASNNTRVTVPTGGDGLYFIRGGSTFAANATGTREMFLRKNATTKMASVRYASAGASDSLICEVSQVLVLVAGDYLELGVSQSSGGALNLGSTVRSQASHLQMVKLW